MAQAKRKNTTKPSRLPARRPDNQIYKQALPRMEYIIDTLATYVVADGWHESWESGPMPKRAADVMAYLRARAAGARENAAQEDKVNAFIADCGQSSDWIFGGDVRGMICRAAGAKAMVTRQSVKEIAKYPSWNPRFWMPAIWRWPPVCWAPRMICLNAKGSRSIPWPTCWLKNLKRWKRRGSVSGGLRSQPQTRRLEKGFAA
jgi:hypothetical protein